MSEGKRKVGRPSKFEELDLHHVECLSERGWTNEQMADFFRVSVRTWYRWQDEHPEFCHAIKDWKQKADEMVEQSLFHRAVGYSCTETKIVTNEGRITDTQDVIKHYPPDTGAAAFWLKNRRPERWRDTNRVEFDDKTEGIKVTDEKLDQMLDAKLEALNIGGEDVQEKA